MGNSLSAQQEVKAASGLQQGSEAHSTESGVKLQKVAFTDEMLDTENNSFDTNA